MQFSILVKENKRVLVFILGQVVNLFSDWMILSSIGNLFGYSYAGTFSLAFSVSSIIFIIASYQLQTYQVVVSYDRVPKENIFVTQLKMCLIAFFFQLIIIFFLKYDFPLIIAIFILGSEQVIIAGSTAMTSSLQKDEHVETFGVCALFRGGSQLFIFYFSYLIFNNFYISIALKSVVASAVFAIIAYRKYKTFYGEKPPYWVKKRINSINIISENFPIMISSLIPIMITAIPKVMIEISYNTEIQGYYSTLSSISQVIPTVMSCLYVPIINKWRKLYEKREYTMLTKNYIFTILGISAILSLCYILLVPLLKKIILTVYGSTLLNYMSVLDFAIIAMVFLGVANATIPLVILVSVNNVEISISLLSLIICFASVRIMVESYGVQGASMTLVLTYFVMAMCNFVLILIKLSQKKKCFEE